MAIRELYDYQIQVAKLLQAGKSVILQAPTGAGKTFASLYPFLEAWDAQNSDFPRKCIYAVPMRVLANQFNEHYDDFISNKMRTIQPPQVKRQTGEYREDAELHGDLIFATIDQILSSWLLHPYAQSRRKGNLNAGAIVGSYLIFDEFHLFDPDNMLPTTLHMLQTLRGVSPFVLMTATFSADMLQELANLLDAVPLLLTDADLADLPNLQKTRTFFTADAPLVQDEQINTQTILEKHAQQNGKKRSVVICNQVKRAQALYRQLKDEAPPDTVFKLLHSRFRPEDRATNEAFVRDEFGKEKETYTAESVILIATQVVEVGVDITCQTLHTELAPASSVLQRAGRCARYEGEIGEVFVYPAPQRENKDGELEPNYAPYHGRLAKQQCILTWAWLQKNHGRVLDFPTEQDLINHAHTATDQSILLGLQTGAENYAIEIEKAWDGLRDGDVSDLIRNIQSQAIIIHSDPENEQILRQPFKTELFSLYPGTLKGLWDEWQDLLADDFNEVDWLAYKLVEDKKQPDKTDEQAAQANRPPPYGWLKVKSPHELIAPALLINPLLVGYDAEIGLTLEAGTYFESDVPPASNRRDFDSYGYKLESYTEHIRLVHEAWRDEVWPSLAPAARRLERAFGWADRLLDDIAQLTIWAHDLGKLTAGWQGWSRRWQEAIGREVPTHAVAHTDYDPNNEREKGINRKMGRQRPRHAVESVVIGTVYFADWLRDNPPVAKAALTAVARHHAPFSREPQSYLLDDTAVQAIRDTTPYLPEHLQHLAQRPLDSVQQRNITPRLQQTLDDNLLVDVRQPAEQLTYMLLVRALRFADQIGTAKGSL